MCVGMVKVWSLKVWGLMIEENGMFDDDDGGI